MVVVVVLFRQQSSAVNKIENSLFSTELLIPECCLTMADFMLSGG